MRFVILSIAHLICAVGILYSLLNHPTAMSPRMADLAFVIGIFSMLMSAVHFAVFEHQRKARLANAR